MEEYMYIAAIVGCVFGILSDNPFYQAVDNDKRYS